MQTQHTQRREDYSGPWDTGRTSGSHSKPNPACISIYNKRIQRTYQYYASTLNLHLINFVLYLVLTDVTTP